MHHSHGPTAAPMHHIRVWISTRVGLDLWVALRTHNPATLHELRRSGPVWTELYGGRLLQKSEGGSVPLFPQVGEHRADRLSSVLHHHLAL
eukprot:2515698-Rhodomonas_salina.2